MVSERGHWRKTTIFDKREGPFIGIRWLWSQALGEPPRAASRSKGAVENKKCRVELLKFVPLKTKPFEKHRFLENFVCRPPEKGRWVRWDSFFGWSWWRGYSYRLCSADSRWLGGSSQPISPPSDAMQSRTPAKTERLQWPLRASTSGLSILWNVIQWSASLRQIWS